MQESNVANIVQTEEAFISKNGLKIGEDILEWRVVIVCDVLTSATPRGVMIVAHHIESSKGNLWRVGKSLISCGEEGVAKEYCRQIEKRLEKESRPKRVLVLINQIAGRGDGMLVYKNTVRPLLELAGVQCKERVSAYAGHTKDILRSFDIHSVDSILLMGGDGTYQESLDVLIPRAQVNLFGKLADYSAPLQTLGVTIAVIPTGTGNGVSQGCYGCTDVETAVLHVITGRSRFANVINIDGACQETYCGFVGSVGAWCDLQARADGLRWMGIFRHKVGRLSLYLWKNPTFDVEISYLASRSSPSESDLIQTDIAVPTHSSENEASSSTKEWLTIRGPITGINVFPVGFYEQEGCESLRWNPGGEAMLVVVERPTSSWTYASWMADMQSLKTKALHYDFITYFYATEVRMKMLSSTHHPARISVDGEIRELNASNIHFRLHKHAVKLHSSSTNSLDI